MIPDQMIMLFMNETERGMAAILKVLEQLDARLGKVEATNQSPKGTEGGDAGTRA